MHIARDTAIFNFIFTTSRNVHFHCFWNYGKKTLMVQGTLAHLTKYIQAPTSVEKGVCVAQMTNENISPCAFAQYDQSFRSSFLVSGHDATHPPLKQGLWSVSDDTQADLTPWWASLGCKTPFNLTGILQNNQIKCCFLNKFCYPYSA